jgi:hypothetical protein
MRARSRSRHRPCRVVRETTHRPSPPRERRG